MKNFDAVIILEFFKNVNIQQPFNEYFEHMFNMYIDLFQSKKGFVIIYDHARDQLKLSRKLNVDDEKAQHVYNHYLELIETTSSIIKKEHKGRLKEEIYKLGDDFFLSIPFYGNESMILLISVSVDNENILEEIFNSSQKQIYIDIKDKIERQYEDIYEYKISQIKNKEMRALYEVGKVMSGTLELQSLMTKIIDMMRDVLDSEAASVFMYDEETDELYFYIAQGEKAESVKEIRLPMGTGIAGWCAEKRLPVFVPDTSKDPRFYKKADDKSKFVTNSLVAVPMVNKDKLIGVLEVLNKKGELPYSKHDVELMEAISTLVVNAFENAALYSNLNNMYLNTIKVLSAALDAKDQYTQGHSERVAMYSVMIAKKMGYSKR
ncbi:GAF domain-containing protein, partial [bacterium]|nr:GAF domain-containing protein [bacterium]